MKLTKKQLRQFIKEELGHPDAAAQPMWDIDLQGGRADFVTDLDPDDYDMGEPPSVALYPTYGDNYLILVGLRAPEYNGIIDENGDVRPIGRVMSSKYLQRALQRYAEKEGL
tara:strand:- start:152 stop:487 length:336 start_codon:yes stop_codon:yes gene_type:complete